MNSKETIRELPEIMTLTEVAAFLRVRRHRSWQLVRRGQLPSFRVGKTYRVMRVNLEKFIKEGDHE
jgi:excisionase family DNA binding protein